MADVIFHFLEEKLCRKTIWDDDENGLITRCLCFLTPRRTLAFLHHVQILQQPCNGGWFLQVLQRPFMAGFDTVDQPKRPKKALTVAAGNHILNYSCRQVLASGGLFSSLENGLQPHPESQQSLVDGLRWIFCLEVTQCATQRLFKRGQSWGFHHHVFARKQVHRLLLVRAVQITDTVHWNLRRR